MWCFALAVVAGVVGGLSIGVRVGRMLERAAAKRRDDDVDDDDVDDRLQVWVAQTGHKVHMRSDCRPGSYQVHVLSRSMVNRKLIFVNWCSCCAKGMPGHAERRPERVEEDLK